MSIHVPGRDYEWEVPYNRSSGRIQVNNPVFFLMAECVKYGDVASQKKKTYNTGVTEYRITGMVGNR